MSIKIGNLELASPWVLAPLAGFTDAVMRTLCEEQGASLTYTEMVSAKAVLYNNKNTDLLMLTKPEEGPASLQLFGSDPEIMADIADRLSDIGFVGFDINMGCPVPKIVNNNEGSALMKDPILAGKIVETMAKRVKCPVTVKFRKGFDENNLKEIAGKLTTTMIIGQAISETTGIYGFITAILILFV